MTQLRWWLLILSAMFFQAYSVLQGCSKAGSTEENKVCKSFCPPSGTLYHRVLTKIPPITVAPHRTSHGEDRVGCGVGVRDGILERCYYCAEMRHKMRRADRSNAGLREENKVQGWPEEFWPKHLHTGLWHLFYQKHRGRSTFAEMSEFIWGHICLVCPWSKGRLCVGCSTEGCACHSYKMRVLNCIIYGPLQFHQSIITWTKNKSKRKENMLKELGGEYELKSDIYHYKT